MKGLCVLRRYGVWGLVLVVAACGSPPTDDASLPTHGSIAGVVWHDVCSGAPEGPRVPAAPATGCVARAGDGLVADGTRAANEPGIFDVEVALVRGSCSAAPITSVTTDGQGRFRFDHLSAGTYCVVIEALNDANAGRLLPGGWTAPSGAGREAHAESIVTLGDGEQRSDLGFGWDFHLLP